MKTSLIFGVALGLAGALSIGGAYAGSATVTGKQSSQYDRQSRDSNNYYGYGRQSYDTERDSVLDLGDVRRSARQAFNDNSEDGKASLQDFAPSSTWDRFRASEQFNGENLNRRQFLSMIDEMFDEVDRNGNGVLDHDELDTPKGRALLRIIG